MNRSLLTVLFIAPFFLASSTTLPMQKQIARQTHQRPISPLLAALIQGQGYTQVGSKTPDGPGCSVVYGLKTLSTVFHQSRMKKQVEPQKMISQHYKQAFLKTFKGLGWTVVSLPLLALALVRPSNPMPEDLATGDNVVTLLTAVAGGSCAYMGSKNFVEAKQHWRKASEGKLAMKAYEKKAISKSKS